MFGRSKSPLDQMPYSMDPRSRLLNINEIPGNYVYVVDLDEQIHIVEDGPHLHPKILGNRRAVLYAGEIEIDSNGVVAEINNLSGTFRFQSKKTLCCVSQHIHQLGFTVNKVIWHSNSGGYPRSLTCPGVV